MILAPLILGLLITFFFTVGGVFINYTNYFANIKSNRQNIANPASLNDNYGIYKKQTDHKITYVNNQLTRDNTFSFEIKSNGYMEYSLIFNDYDILPSPKTIYVYIYKKGANDAILSNTRTLIRQHANLLNLGSVINLNHFNVGGLYKVQPNSNNEVIIRGNNVDHYLHFFVYNATNKGIIWELQKKGGNDVQVLNIQKQVTKINKQEFENYYQGDGLNGIVILNGN